MSDIIPMLSNSETLNKLGEKLEDIAKGLFGQAFEETGGLIADQVRYRRLKNQIKIFQKVKDNLRGTGLDLKNINLKVLAPLLEYSSYEEEQNMQDRWSKLIESVLVKDLPTTLQLNLIEILKKMSNPDAMILKSIYGELIKERKKFNIEAVQGPSFKDEDVSLTEFSVHLYNAYDEKTFELFDYNQVISNLISFGLIQPEITAALKNQHITVRGFSEHIPLNFNVTIDDHSKLKITKLGTSFMESCE